MSPEFLAILEERENLARLSLFMPTIGGLFALLISFFVKRKLRGFVLITLVALATVLIPTFMLFAWFDELTQIATSEEDTLWVLNHDGGGQLIAPLMATAIAGIFWIMGTIVLAIRGAVSASKRDKIPHQNVDF